MLTCLCDAFYGEVGIAATRVLEAAGCGVVFDERQTCCGQPAFNAGDWPAARSVADHCRKVLFESEAPVVIPSGSCAAMIREGYHLLYDSPPVAPAFELAEFLVTQLNVDSWPPKGQAKPVAMKAAFHASCHGVTLGTQAYAPSLLATIPGFQVVPFEQSDQCCGFGGAFSVGLPTVSTGIGTEKLRCIVESGADTVVGGDMGCLMHLEGLAQRQGLKLRFLHYAQVLADALGPEVDA